LDIRISGFPVSIGDLGVSWKPNPEILKISSQFAIQKTYDMQYSYEEIQNFHHRLYKKLAFSQWNQSKNQYSFIVSLIIFVFLLSSKKRIITLICISLIDKSILVTFFSAQYRFFMDVFFVIFFILFMNILIEEIGCGIFCFKYPLY
jgi:hypothetical protein